jgi:hypothetical protein
MVMLEEIGEYVTMILISLTFPELSVALALIVFEPEDKVTDLLQDVVPEAICHPPEPILTSTLLTPLLSEAEPETVMLEAKKV